MVFLVHFVDSAHQTSPVPAFVMTSVVCWFSLGVCNKEVKKLLWREVTRSCRQIMDPFGPPWNKVQSPERNIAHIFVFFFQLALSLSPSPNFCFLNKYPVAEHGQDLSNMRMDVQAHWSSCWSFLFYFLCVFASFHSEKMCSFEHCGSYTYSFYSTVNADLTPSSKPLLNWEKSWEKEREDRSRKNPDFISIL